MSDFIYPELGEKTNAQIEYRCSTYKNGWYYITTDLELSGRGIELNGDGSTHKRGKKTYWVSKIAFKKLKEKYSTCYIADL